MTISRPSFAGCVLAGLALVFAARAQAQQPAALATATASAAVSAPATQASAATPPGQASASSQQAESLMLEVRNLVDGADSIECSTSHQIHLFDRQILGTGHYYQQGHGFRRLTRSERNSQVGDRTDTSFELCDGAYFWTFRGTTTVGTLTQVNLQRVRQAWDDARAANPQLWNREPAISGLPRLIDALIENFRFERIAPGHIGQRPVWIVYGSWKPDKLAAAIPDQKANIEAGRPIDLKRLPTQLPEHIVFEVAQDNPRFFPCRLAYFRPVGNSLTEQGRGGEGGAPPGYRAIVTINWFDVKINQPIDPQKFVYQPSGQAADATTQCLKELHLLTTAQK